MNEIGKALKSSHEVKNSSPDQLINNFVMSRAIRLMINKEYARLRKGTKKMNLSMQTDSGVSFFQRRALSAMASLVEWQKEIAMIIASNEVTNTSATLSPSSLMEGVPLYPEQPTTPWSFISEFNKERLTPENEEALKKLDTWEESVAYLQNMGLVRKQLFKEDQLTEKKARIQDPRGTAKGLLESVIATHNSKILYGITGKIRAIAGIDDLNDNPTGLEMELIRLHPTFTLDKWEHIVIRNVARSYSQQPEFERNLDVNWYNYQNHLILILSVKDFNQLILTRDKSTWTLPVRISASVRRLQGYELLNAVVSKNIINN